MESSFRRALVASLRGIPRGHVTTCGALAHALGEPRAAKAVSTWLRAHPDLARAHRVVLADGSPILAEAVTGLRAEGTRLVHGRVADRSLFARPTASELFAALRREQRRLARAVIEEDRFTGPRTIAGVDVAYSNDTAHVAAVSFEVERLEPTQVVEASVRVEFPYVATYLAYRESGPARLVARQLEPAPDILLVDGHGKLHPAGSGLACDVGVRLDIPTIGVAKHGLVGEISRPRRPESSLWPIDYAGRNMGFAWRPEAASRPLFISVGHRISLPSALSIVQRVTKRSMPEPLLVADRYARKRKEKQKREQGSKV